MFKRFLLGLVMTTFVLPMGVPVTSAEDAFNINALDNYFIFEEDTWWDYVHSIEYGGSADIPDSVNVVDDMEEATVRSTALRCKYANCTTYASEDSANTFSFVAENGVVSIQMINNYDVDIKVLDVDGFSGNVDSLMQTLYGIMSSSNIESNQACEFTYEGEEEVGGYIAGVIENTCTLSFDYDDSVYGSTPTLLMVSRDIYMENVGKLYSEMQMYEDNEWQYTLYETLVETSIDLISFDDQETSSTSDETTAEDESTEEMTDEGSETSTEASAPDNPFTDLRETHRNYEAIMYLYGENIIGGYDDGTFKANNTLNRAELLKILVEGKGLTPDAAVYRNCFNDVVDDWYAPYVCYAKEMGWVSGYDDGSFKPADIVNKAEALKMLLNSQGIATAVPTEAPYSDVSISDWFAPYVAKAKELGILEEDTDTFLPDSDRTRGSICENLYRLLTSTELE